LQNGFLANIRAADEITEAQLNQEITELAHAGYVLNHLHTLQLSK